MTSPELDRLRAYQANRAVLRSCPSHYFDVRPETRFSEFLGFNSFQCRLCKGTVDSDFVITFLAGARQAGGNLALMAAKEVLDRCGYVSA